MGIDLGSIGNLGCGVIKIPLHKAREFRLKPRWYRFARVYLWIAANGIQAAIVIVAGAAFIYFVTHWKELATGR
jgi:hypothetical protein